MTRGNWAESDVQEVLPEVEEEELYRTDDQALEQVAQRGYGVSLTEGVQNYLDAILCYVLWGDLA